ncbi:MAG: hypothetical protein QNI87_14930 [Erythrobacter sp.]|uniref:hypothetical protein n=1 Tax=Erythrobacter sp. TaxID=1042 RepID=UPI002619CC3D|nr:hypothetical protein [Erythrobacter sp.]MDJ0979817.1 hypothetical protein [Erythrobacter sp.]
MDSFLFCLILVALLGLGGRDQIVIAQLSDTLAERGDPLIRRPVPLLILGLVCAGVTAGVMAYAGATLAQIVPSRAARMLVAFALALAAVELAWPVRARAPREPTRSLGAIGLVLLWRQLGDAARFVVFAFAVGAPYPLTALLGGALGGGATVTIGWTLGAQTLSRWPLGWIRFGFALPTIIAAVFIGLNARYGAP